MNFNPLALLIFTICHAVAQASAWTFVMGSMLIMVVVLACIALAERRPCVEDDQFTPERPLPKPIIKQKPQRERFADLEDEEWRHG